MQPDSNRLLTAAEVAERWQVAVDAVHRLAHEGRIPCTVRIGRWIRFTPSGIEAFESEGGVAPVGDEAAARLSRPARARGGGPAGRAGRPDGPRRSGARRASSCQPSCPRTAPAGQTSVWTLT